ncbi:hypothetical protein PUV47_06930 [Pseudovibrio exalbescens]|uniref:hypothetical protein n=1 Tax=Pseudovibrio exalbescens TaxID=197461 RepID=UPI002365BC59|nr:hypothetical protein [Pseudovibrio exalbescens]MDD7909647.1 hypothetical protein [Pseudovibrio exalbescens]
MYAPHANHYLFWRALGSSDCNNWKMTREMVMKKLLTALIISAGLIASTGAKEVPLIWGEKQEIQSVVKQLDLPDDKRNLVHMILEEARVNARRIYQDAGAELGETTNMIQRVQISPRMAELEREIMMDLSAILTEAELSEFRRSATLVKLRASQQNSRQNDETTTAAALFAR